MRSKTIIRINSFNTKHFVKQFLAKSDGTLLSDHSKMVASVAHGIALGYFKDLPGKIINTIYYAGLFHDIGKATKEFQDVLMKNEEEDETPKKKIPFHNEIGWAFLEENLKESDSYDKGLICNAVLYHHGIDYSTLEKNSTQILDSISSIDFMKEFFLSVSKTEMLSDEGSDVIPNYFHHGKSEQWKKNDNIALIIVRSCVIFADRIVSGNPNASSDDIDKLITNIIFKENNIDLLNNFPYSDKKRFEEQVRIGEKAIENNIAIVKAPAGYGKTLTGLIWSNLTKKKTIWVCPRNMVAEAVYENLISELDAFGQKLSVELFLSGEVKKSTNNESKPFSSDIIVTNIDNFLRPVSENQMAYFSVFISSSNVIFDEYHELVQENALFPLFVNIMKIRQHYSRANTLLLSATPINISDFWDDQVNRTLILPNEKSHFSPSHNKKYKIFIHKEFPENVKDNSLVIFNAIKNAQQYKHDNQSASLFHGNFMVSDKSNHMSDLMGHFGKNKIGIQKDQLVGTLIIQAALNISLKNLYESILSPESTMQRIGRCNRWGEYDDSELHFFNMNDRSESLLIKNTYDEKLREEWVKFILPFHGKELSLQELYDEYNKFNEALSTLLKKYIRSQLDLGSSSLTKIQPLRYYSKASTKNIKAGGNKLRSTGNEIFFICKKTDGNEWSEPFSVAPTLPFSIEFGEDKDTLRRMIKEIERLNDDRYEWGKIVSKKYVWKNITLDRIRNEGKNSITPYMRFDVKYHPVYGVIKTNLLESFNN